MEARLILLDDREEASILAAELAAGHIAAALSASGRASFMASGGSSPGHMYSLLSSRPLDWRSVTVGLVDERWVAPDHPASNEKLVRSKLLQGPAAEADFLPMKTDAATPQGGMTDRTAAYAPHVKPVSCILLGMGPDGHTASWFPGSEGLDAALHPAEGDVIAAIDAASSPCAGEYPLRMTLTAGAVCAAESAILLIFGDDKRSVLEQSLKGDEKLYPVRRAIDGLGRRLTIIWAP